MPTACIGRSELQLALVAALVLPCCRTPGDLPPAADSRYEDCSSSVGQEALDRAWVLIVDGLEADAIPDLRLVLRECPDHVRTHLLYYETATQVGVAEPELLAEMHRFYREAEEDDGSSPVWPYMQARLAEHDADRQDLLEVALRRDPSFYWAHLSAARIWRWHGRASRALAALDRALAARRSFAEARLERAEVLVELGRYREAGGDYTNYLRQRPRDRPVLRRYARLLIYDLERFEEAERIVGRMLEDDPDDVDALMGLAAIDWRAGRTSAAVDGYHRVLALDPTQARAVLNLGNLYYDAHWRDGAMDQGESWTRARRAYRFYLNMARTEDRFDYWDYHFSVPYRLRNIADQLGEDDELAPTLEDF